MGHEAPGTRDLGPVARPVEIWADDVAPQRRRRWAGLRRDPAFWIGGGLVVLFIAVGVLAPVLTPWNPDFQDRSVASYPSPASWEHPLGTDKLGRDLLSRLMFGARIALVVGVGAALLAVAIGFLVGLFAAYFRSPRLGIPLPRGRRAEVPIPVESTLMRTTDVFLSLPALLLAIALVAVLHPSVGLTAAVLVLVLWTGPARIIYGAVRSVRDSEFVLAARALGTSSRRIVFRHVAPQVTGLALAYGAITVAVAILFEASLSYLGAGVPIPAPSWGGMAAEHLGSYVAAPHLVILPGAAILLAVLGFTLLGDALRDASDPRARR
jgi:peptide/nickel transport system permease protein